MFGPAGAVTPAHRTGYQCMAPLGPGSCTSCGLPMYGPDGAVIPAHHAGYQCMAPLGPESLHLMSATNVWPRWGE